MATPLIAYPFRVTPDGDVATVLEGSDEQYAQELAVAALTRTDERPLVPNFGTADPTFRGFDLEALRLHVDLFGPPVDLAHVDVRYLNDSTQDVVIHFSST